MEIVLEHTSTTNAHKIPVDGNNDLEANISIERGLPAKIPNKSLEFVNTHVYHYQSLLNCNREARYFWTV